MGLGNSSLQREDIEKEKKKRMEWKETTGLLVHNKLKSIKSLKRNEFHVNSA